MITIKEYYNFSSKDVSHKIIIIHEYSTNIQQNYITYIYFINKTLIIVKAVIVNGYKFLKIIS